MKLLSVNASLPKEVQYNGKTITTSSFNLTLGLLFGSRSLKKEFCS